MKFFSTFNSLICDRKLQVKLKESELHDLRDVTDKCVEKAVYVGWVGMWKHRCIEGTLLSPVVLEDQSLANT